MATKITAAPLTRPLYEVAAEVKADWSKAKSGVYFGAVPYLDAMSTLRTMDEDYYADPASEVVMYFLANATSWRGETAQRVKGELKAALKDAGFRI